MKTFKCKWKIGDKEHTGTIDCMHESDLQDHIKQMGGELIEILEVNEKEELLSKLKKCPYCAEEIQYDALKCKYCKEWLNRKSEEEWITIAPMIGEERNCKKTMEKKSHQKVIVGNVKNPGVAFILSFFMPGLGQFYNGHIWQGFLVLILFWILIWTIVGGIIVWVIGMIEAYYSAKRINEEVINS